jgi:hypothetical protein
LNCLRRRHISPDFEFADGRWAQRGMEKRTTPWFRTLPSRELVLNPSLLAFPEIVQVAFQRPQRGRGSAMYQQMTAQK